MKKHWKGSLLVGFGLLILVGCGEREGLAPVVESNWHRAQRAASHHTVVRGETLYSIAFRYDKDYRALARLNQLPSPYLLRVGQVLSLAGQPVRAASVKFVPATVAAKQPARTITQFTRTGWQWPARGRVVHSFHPKQGKKGIDIAGQRGDKVYAASSGVVAYAGDGLVGYGNLIIIKHKDQYLTAYGNNARNFVKEGQHVAAGQVIAEMGYMHKRFWGVHFEIRKMGQPVNPLHYLK